MRDHANVVGLGNGRDLLGVGQATDHADVGPDEPAPTCSQKFIELPDGVQAFARRDWHRDASLQVTHALDAVGHQRVFQKVRPVLRQFQCEARSVVRVHATVDLDTQVHAVSDRLPDRGDARKHLFQEFGVAQFRVVVREGCEPDGGEPVPHRRRRACCEIVGCLTTDVHVEAYAVPTLSAQELPCRHPEMLARDVPEREVDRTQGRHDDRAAKMGISVEELPVVFDLQRILPQQVGLPRLQDATDCLGVAVDAPLTKASDALLCMYQEVEPPADLKPFHPADPHPTLPSALLADGIRGGKGHGSLPVGLSGRHAGQVVGRHGTVSLSPGSGIA